MNVASVAPVVASPAVMHAAVNGADLAEKISIRNLEFLLRRQPGAQGHQPAALREARSRPSSARRAAASRRCCACSTACTTSIRNQRAEGEVMFDGEDILSPKQDLNLLRARIGMVFQKPTPFPMSIYENIAFGIRLYEKLPKSELDGRVETALRRAALWDEVKDKLNANGLSLSGGQQQRLCIARTVAVQARGDPVRRAVLGARSDLDRQDRGADRRAEDRLHDRDRHPQHAAGGARLRLHRLHVSRRADRVRHHQQDVHRAAATGARRTTSPAASADAPGAERGKENDNDERTYRQGLRRRSPGARPHGRRDGRPCREADRRFGRRAGQARRRSRRARGRGRSRHRCAAARDRGEGGADHRPPPADGGRSARDRRARCASPTTSSGSAISPRTSASA